MVYKFDTAGNSFPILISAVFGLLSSFMLTVTCHFIPSSPEHEKSQRGPYHGSKFFFGLETEGHCWGWPGKRDLGT